MTDVAPLPAKALRQQPPVWKLYFSLLKPRVMSLVVFTAAAGLVVVPTGLSLLDSILSILLIALGGGASGALNMWWDADIDAVMRRTQGRPIPAGLLSPRAVLVFGLLLSTFSVVALGLVANWLAAALLVMTIFYYVVIYSMWLKRRTPQNIVIGGLSGAFPPMIGWAAATGDISLQSLFMVLLIFMWTPPHFWALALFIKDDYSRAGVPMLTVTHGRRVTRRHIFAYACLLAPVALLPVAMGLSGPIYLAAAVVLNLRFVAGAWRLLKRDEEVAKMDGFAVERRYFRQSLTYLFLHFAALIADRMIDTAALILPW